MFAQENGRPIDPSADRAEWRDILTEAGAPNARLHDARHTAATVLALLEVAPRAAMDFMGWSNPDMVLRYQHITDAMRRDIAKRIDGHLWDAPEDTPKTEN
jgi:integrase